MNDNRHDVATLAGGCFWCIEAVFEQLQGVEKVVSGYTGGHAVKPTYQQVCTGRTGHAEAVQITFNPQEISYGELLEVFFVIHDPTTLNRQGPDVGTQYRSAVFFHNAEQKSIAEQTIRKLEQSRVWGKPIVTEIKPIGDFYIAEGYHQGYYRQNSDLPYCSIVIAPKVAKLRKLYLGKLKKQLPV